MPSSARALPVQPPARSITFLHIVAAPLNSASSTGRRIRSSRCLITSLTFKRSNWADVASLLLSISFFAAARNS